MKSCRLLSLVLVILMSFTIPIISEADSIYFWGEMSFSFPAEYEVSSESGDEITAFDASGYPLVITKKKLSEMYGEAIINHYTVKELLDNSYDSAKEMLFSDCSIIDEGQIDSAEYLIYSGNLYYDNVDSPGAGIVIISGDYFMEMLLTKQRLEDAEKAIFEFASSIENNGYSKEFVIEANKENSHFEKVLDLDNKIFPLDTSFKLGIPLKALLENCNISEYTDDQNDTENLYMVTSQTEDIDGHKQVILIRLNDENKVIEVMSIFCDIDIDEVYSILKDRISQSSMLKSGSYAWIGSEAALLLGQKEEMLFVDYVLIADCF